MDDPRAADVEQNAERDSARPAAAEPAPAAVETGQVRAAGIVDGVEHQVDPRSVTVARLVGALTVSGVAFAVLVALTIAWALGGIPSRIYLPLLLGWSVVLSVACFGTYKWPELHHRHLRYRVDEAGVRIRRGVLWRKVISIPTSRVQHTDVSQGPVQRHYELATLTVYTAGTENASIALEGLEQTTARRLRDHLLPDHEEADDD